MAPYPNTLAPHLGDLVPGQSYRTRDNQEVLITCVDPELLAVEGRCIVGWVHSQGCSWYRHTWLQNGRYHGSRESEMDLLVPFQGGFDA